jgi:hypothetical protein
VQAASERGAAFLTGGVLAVDGRHILGTELTENGNTCEGCAVFLPS